VPFAHTRSPRLGRPMVPQGLQPGQDRGLPRWRPLRELTRVARILAPQRAVRTSGSALRLTPNGHQPAAAILELDLGIRKLVRNCGAQCFGRRQWAFSSGCTSGAARLAPGRARPQALRRHHPGSYAGRAPSWAG